MRKILLLLLVSFSLLGLMNASYITWNEFNQVIPPCRPPFSCEEVLSSSWSHIGPVPLPVVGMIFYLMFLIMATLQLFEVKEYRLGKYHVQLELVLVTMGVTGLLFSLYLVTIMAVVLQAWCMYCLISAFDAVLLFILSSLLYFSGRK